MRNFQCFSWLQLKKMINLMTMSRFLNNFFCFFFFAVEIKCNEDKIRLLAEFLADAKNARLRY